LGKLGAGTLMFGKRDSMDQVFLVHPGGHFWQRKDADAWSIPTGEYKEGDDPLDAPKREFEEETGMEAEGEFMVKKLEWIEMAQLAVSSILFKSLSLKLP